MWHIHVRTEAHLDCWIKDYFDGLAVQQEKGGTTLLTGELQDMSAVYGLILRLRDAGIVLWSLRVERIPKDQ